MGILDCGVVGIHGFAQRHLRSLLALQASGQARLVAAVAHERARDEAWARELEGAGVRLVGDLDALLALGVAVVTLPVGIALHAPLALRCLAAGRHVYLEKPVAATIAEVDALAAAERRSGRTLLVGFQDLFQDGVRALKRRLAAGELGAVRRIVTTTGWPRPPSYYLRNSWAGRLEVDGAQVLDSVANNACAHFLNLALFLAGAKSDSSARPRTVAAQLWRGHAIDSFDTCAIRVTTAEGPEIHFAASHLGATTMPPALRIECAGGTIVNDDLDGERPWHLAAAGLYEEIPVIDRHLGALAHALRCFAGEDVPVCRLAQARAHTAVVAAAHRSCPIATFPAEHLIAGEDYLVHPQIDRCLATAHERGIDLAAAGLEPTPRGAHVVEVEDMPSAE